MSAGVGPLLEKASNDLANAKVAIDVMIIRRKASGVHLAAAVLKVEEALAVLRGIAK